MGRMMTNSVAFGALFTLLGRARAYKQEPFKKYGTLAVGGAAIAVGMEVVDGLVKEMAL
jgi:hypothetical protein